VVKLLCGQPHNKVFLSEFISVFSCYVWEAEWLCCNRLIDTARTCTDVGQSGHTAPRRLLLLLQ